MKRVDLDQQAVLQSVHERVIGGMLGHQTRSSTSRYAHLNQATLNQMLNRSSQLAEEGPSENRQEIAKVPGKLLNIKRKTG
jgi:hypothetical protein